MHNFASNAAESAKKHVKFVNLRGLQRLKADSWPVNGQLRKTT